jgi:hypothetical protein
MSMATGSPCLAASVTTRAALGRSAPGSAGLRRLGELLRDTADRVRQRPLLLRVEALRIDRAPYLDDHGFVEPGKHRSSA